jgi:RHS repeat-associated protein
MIFGRDRPANAGPISLTLAYDDLYRLLSASFALAPLASSTQLPQFGPSDPTSIDFKIPRDRVKRQTFGYDTLGNVKTSADNANALMQRSAGTATYGNSSSGGVLRPNQLAAGKSGSAAYTTAYDAAGNLTSISATLPAKGFDRSLSLTLTYLWDEAGHLQQATSLQSARSFKFKRAKISTVTKKYLYDGRGIRTWTSSNGAGPTRYNLEVFPSLRLNGTTVDSHDVKVKFPAAYKRDGVEQVYLLSGSVGYGRLVLDSTLPSPSGHALHTFLQITDPHGSMSSIIDKETSELVEQITYLANGQTETDFRPTRWNQFRETYRYTGKEDDYQVGLTYYGARYFASSIGRWASPDPLTIHALGSNPNPYSFMRASPFRYVDRLGLDDDPNEQVCEDPQTCEQKGSEQGQGQSSGAGQTGGLSPGPFAIESGPPNAGSSASLTGGSGFGPFAPIYGGYVAPPPTPAPVMANSTNGAWADQQSTWSASVSFPGDIDPIKCDSMHTEFCEHEFVRLGFGLKSLFGFIGGEKEFGRLPVQAGGSLRVGLAREGFYVKRTAGSGIQGLSGEAEKSESLILARPGVSPIGLGANLQLGPLGVMIPAQSIQSWNNQNEPFDFTVTLKGKIFGVGADFSFQKTNPVIACIPAEGNCDSSPISSWFK